jgi:hypothetical protein
MYMMLNQRNTIQSGIVSLLIEAKLQQENEKVTTPHRLCLFLNTPR